MSQKRLGGFFVVHGDLCVSKRESILQRSLELLVDRADGRHLTFLLEMGREPRRQRDLGRR